MLMSKIKAGLQAVTGKQVLNFLKDNFLWILGCSIYAMAVNTFALPNSIAQSGVTGLAILVNKLIDAPVGVTNFVLNVPLLVLAYLFIGKRFVAKTLWVTVILSVALDTFALFMPAYTGDRILAALFCGLLAGLGLGIVIVTGATSGGTDIVARLVHQHWQHISIGRVILFADAVIVALSAIIFRSIESALYAVIVIFVSTKVIDGLVYGTGNGKMLMVITSKADEITKAITTKTPRGVSVVPVVGGYTGEQKSMLICVARSSEISAINKLIKSIDDETFTIVSEANEILGKGFSKTL